MSYQYSYQELQCFKKNNIIVKECLQCVDYLPVSSGTIQ